MDGKREDWDEARNEECKTRCICESKPLVRKHTTITVAIGYHPSEGANLDWCLPQVHGNAPLTIPGTCGPIHFSLVTAYRLRIQEQQACSSR
jgi:hypothetical protein